MTFLFIVLQVSNSLLNLVFPLLILAFFYFFMIRPQVKKQKDQAKFSTGLQKGDEVVTTSGIIGQISKIEDNEVTLQIDPKTFIRVVPNAISQEMTVAFKGKVSAIIAK